MELKQQLEALENKLADMPEQSALRRYFTWLDHLVDGNKENEPYKTVYGNIVQQEASARAKHHPFLSVITRTQGKRPEMLRETLLSLVGQSDDDFEVILIGHKLDENQKEVVEQIIAEQPESLCKRIRFLELGHGNRTTPLNMGFAYAHGHYIAVLDDDDVVLDHWVESFHRASVEHDGTILHAYVFTQKWETINAGNGREAVRAVGAPKATYCEPFDILRQMRDNRCPLLGLAFPAYYFQKLGMVFDETLTTTEDWDYLMRVSLVAGVTDVEDVTSIYRLWDNAENSTTLHDKAEWRKNYLLIQDKLMDMPALIPQGSRKSVSQESMLAMSDAWEYRTPRICGCALYLNHGNGFNQQELLMEKALFDGKDFDVRFELSEADAAELCEIRFDVCEEGMFVLQNVLALAECFDGSRENFTLEQCRCNGARAGNAICFLKGDPWVIWPIARNKKLKSIRIIGETHVNMTDKLVRAACRTMGGAEFQLFYSTQKRMFTEMESARAYTPSGPFAVTFPITEDRPITALRLDPGEEAGCILNDLKIELHHIDGTVSSENMSRVQTNGTKTGGMFTFAKEDPQLIWILRGQKLSSVTIRGIFAYAANER